MEYFLSFTGAHALFLILVAGFVLLYTAIVTMVSLRPDSNIAGYFAQNQPEIHSLFFHSITTLFFLELCEIWEFTLLYWFEFGLLCSTVKNLFPYLKELWRRRPH